ncbi:uncharacterized protein LOC114711908 [Neltuma alba]|nr:uncharacterized protein LOC114711908 [Prosopis alba]
MIREVREIPQTTNDYWGFCRFGFGFCSILNDYKIVKFYNQELRKKKEIDQDYDVAKQGHDGVEMYSLSTDSWKELGFGALQNIEVTFTTASTDGMMVWVGERDSFPVLVSFDMVTEVFTITPILSVDGGLPTNLGAYQGKFAIFFRSYGYNSTDIMVMEQVASESGRSLSCTEEYSIDTFSHAPDPVCIWGNEVVFLGIESETDESEGIPGYFLNLFNLTTKKWKEFRNFSSNHDCSAGFTYERSLVSVWNTQVE